jgi:hypothetical protein
MYIDIQLGGYDTSRHISDQYLKAAIEKNAESSNISRQLVHTYLAQKKKHTPLHI